MLIQESNPQFSQVGLKKKSLIRADTIATVSKSVYKRKLGNLSRDLLVKRQKALKISFNNQWLLTEYEEDSQKFSLNILPLSLSLDEIYEGVNFN
ncbi:MAG: type II toxin-antitoxin system PemK/MazF family toxin [Xenococcus sp. MO_188.B8]|nr:type II toxin-antitoxin system PemK/MazF family toxin [Xenococcus sp. MO_188.B8]